MPGSTHEAAENALGYLYQVRWGLLALIRESRGRPDLTLTLELLDDVAFDDRGQASELLQLKHHVSSVGHLGDMSTDVWKTLKVWIDGTISRRPDGPLLSLVSTGSAAPGSAMANLRLEGRDPVAAVLALDKAAKISTNQTTREAREAWLAMPESDRHAMAVRIRLYDKSASVGEVDDLIAQELSTGAPLGHEAQYVDLVIQWWNRVSIDLLLRRRDSISGIDLRARVSEIRDYFRTDNLPTTVQLADVDEDAVALEHQNHVFVRQLEWIDLNPVHLRKAVVDYYRAVTQTTRWLDDSLIGVSEIQEFEDRLVDEWQRAFADMCQELGLQPDSEACKAAGRALLRSLEQSTSVTIRALYGEVFYARGKRHELSNAGQLGWHPNFADMLADLTETA